MSLTSYSKLIECSQEIDVGMPVWPGNLDFSRCIFRNYEEHGYFTENYSMPAGTGTHIDSPGHMIKGGRLIHSLTLEELICPGVVIDVTSKCDENPDYELSIEDLEAHELIHGRIPKGALVCMKTGWGRKFKDPKAYININPNESHPICSLGAMHFPGFSNTLARFLCEQREISGIGIDTLSLDKGLATSFDVHITILGNDKYQIENMYLEDTPPSGFTFISMPLRVKDAAEMSTRVMAIVN
ncbi:hypothetical protein SteCoe_9242 [Stentor coeruleus]|uniref:Cyclase family protein n=1 Tax=Stentor coeruleus TaxID=5963 RepID=A0A1R2CIK0_9CILI|nr:hypothetical protein SteCoe_9242 [Stentor coeruleus]